MKRLLAIIPIVLVLMPETAFAKGKESCVQAVSNATVNTLRGSAALVAIVLFGVYVMSNFIANRRRDKELKDLKGGAVTAKTGIFGQS